MELVLGLMVICATALVYAEMRRTTVPAPRGGVRAASLAVVCASSFACGPPKPPSQTVKVEAEHFKGSNGVEVYILPDPSTSMVQLSVRYTVGSADDPVGKAGLAHLVEHLMFEKPRQGTNRTIKAELQRLGRYTNAYTTEDSTHYIVAAEPAALEELVAIEVERMVTGCDGIDQSTFEREREVVRNEIRRHFIAPTGRTHQLLREAVYPEGHPYRHAVGGDDEQLSAITLEDACAFMEAHYQPHRAIFLVGGNTTAAAVTPIAQAWLSRAPKATKRSWSEHVPEVALTGATYEHELPVEHPELYVIWKAPPTFSADGHMLALIASIFRYQIDGFNYAEHFATSVEVFTIGGAHAPALVIGMTLSNSSDRNEALEFVNKAKRWVGRSLRIHDKGDERGWEFRRTYQSEGVVASVESLAGRIEFFADSAQFDPGGGFVIGRLRELHEMDPKRLRSLAESLIEDNGAIVVIEPDGTSESTYRDSGLAFVPDAHDESRWQVEVDVSEAERDVQIPTMLPPLNVDRFELGNGLEVLLWADASLPLVRGNLVTATGSAHEEQGREGYAWLSSFGNTGADFSDYTVRDMSSQVEDSIKRMAVQLRGFGVRSVDELQRRLEQLVGAKSYDDTRTFNARFNAAVYGENHPYANTGMLSENSVDGLEVDDINDFIRSRYVPSNSVLVLTGKFDPSSARDDIEAEFGYISGKKSASKPVVEPVEKRNATEYVAIHKANGPLLTVRIGFPGGAGVGDDYAARMVLASMLSAKLRSLREGLAVTYGTSASYQPRVGPGLWRIDGTVDAKRAPEAMRAIMTALQELRDGEGSFAADFVLARRELLKDYLIETRNSASILAYLTMVAKFDLDVDFRTDLVGRIATLRMADIRALVEDELTTDNQVVAVMGPRAAVGPALEAARGN